MALVTANQFDLTPDVSRLGQGFAQGQQIRSQFDARQQAQAQLGQQQELQALGGQALGGNQESLTKIAGIDPGRAAEIQSFLSTQSEADRAEGLRENEVLTRTSLDALSLEPVQRRAFLQGKRQEFINEKRDTANIDRALAGDDAALEQMLTLQAREGQSIAQLAEQQFGTKKPTKQAGKEGLVFDTATGTFSVDPVAKARLDEVANKAKTQGGLDFKDRQGLNKDVTSIIKSTIAVKRSAEELDKLKGRGTAAAKLGAVFKYMKSLDPTSVVRETEQGQVYAAEGAASQLAGQINSILGEGKLTERGFDDLVKTAQVIADANIDSVGVEIGALLDTFGNTIPEDFKASLLKRVPERFNVEQETPPPPPPSAAPPAQTVVTGSFADQSDEQLLSF